MSESPVKQYIQKAKSIPVALYLMVVFNIVLFVGLICKELTLLYLVGSLVFVIMLITAIGSATNMWTNPTELISDNVQSRIEQASEKIKRLLTAIDMKQNDSSAMNTLITILFFVYVTSVLNETFEIFLIFNFVYGWIFLPKEVDSLIGLVKQHGSNLLSKIKSMKQ